MQKQSHRVITFTLAALLALYAVGCGTSGVSIREGKQNPTVDVAKVVPSYAAVIVHVDGIERIVTIRKGEALNRDFLIALTPSGEETAVLKLRKRIGGLKTADILEGAPQINNVVTTASEERSKKLAKIYRDPE